MVQKPHIEMESNSNLNEVSRIPPLNSLSRKNECYFMENGRPNDETIDRFFNNSDAVPVVAILGATDYLGAHLTNLFLDKGYKVKAFILPESSAKYEILNTISTVANEQPYTSAKMVCENFVEQLIQVKTGFASENLENASDNFYLNELKLKNLLRILPWFNTTKCQEWENALYGCNYVICNLTHLTQTTPHKQVAMDKNAISATREENNATQNQTDNTEINGNEINQAENVTTNVVELKSELPPNQKPDQEQETQETQELSLDERLELSLKALLNACQNINCQETQQGDNYVAKIKRVIVTSSFMTILGNGNSIVEGKEYTEQDWNSLINTTSKDINTLLISPLIKAMTRCETKLFETIHKSAKSSNNESCNGENKPDDWIKPTDFDIVILNPVFVMGPSIYQNFDYIGFELIRKLLKKDVLSNSVSKLALNIIDVRDVAISHYAALMCPLVSNMRIILNNRSATMKEIAQIAHKELKYASLHRPTPAFLNGLPPKAENNTNKGLEKILPEKVDKNGDIPKCQDTNEKVHDDKSKSIEENVQSNAEITEPQNLPESCQTLTDEKMEEGNKQETEISNNTEEGKTDIKDNTTTSTATNNANNNNFIASLLKSWFFSPPPQNTQNIMDEIDGGNRDGNAKEFGTQNPASNSSIFYNVEQWFNINNVGTGQQNISAAKNASLNILQNPSNLKLGDIVKEIQKNTFPIYSINPNATVPDLICSNYRMRETLRIIPRELHQTISEMTKELIIFCFNNSFQLPTAVNTLETSTNQTTPGKNMGQSNTLINAPLKSTLTTSAVLNSLLNVFGRKDSPKDHQQSDIEIEKSVQMIEPNKADEMQNSLMILPNLDPNVLIPPTDLQHYNTDITRQEEGCLVSESSRNPLSEEPIISSKAPTKSENVKKPQTDKIATGKSFQHKLQHSLSMNRIKMFTVRNSKNNPSTKENSENTETVNGIEIQKQNDNFDGKNELEPLEKEGTEIETVTETVSKPPSLTKLGKKKWSLHYPSNPLINFSLIRHPLHTGTQENQENQKLLKLKLKHSSNKQENTDFDKQSEVINTEENSMPKNKNNLEAMNNNEMLVKSLNENIEQNSETTLIPTVKEKSSTIGSGFTNMAKCFPHYFKSLVSDHHSSKSHSISGPPSSVSSKSNTIEKIDDSKTENTCKITEELPKELSGENFNKPSLSHIEEGTLLLSPSFVTYVKVESDHISTVSTGNEQPLESCSKINTILFSPTNKLLRSNLISGCQFNTTNSNSKNSNNKHTTPPVVLIARRTLSPDGENINTESIINKNQNLSDITLLASPKKTCLVQVKTPELNNGAGNSVFCNGGDSKNHSDEETNVKTGKTDGIEIENNLVGPKISGHRRNPSLGLINPTISSNDFEKIHENGPLTNGRHHFEGDGDILETLENGYNHSSLHLNGFHHFEETQLEENAEGEISDNNDGIVKEPTTIVEITAKKSNVNAYNFEVGTNPRSPTSSTNMTIINA